MLNRGFLILAPAAMVASCATGVSDVSPPHLDKIELRETVARYDLFYPTFFFHAPGGDVVEVRRQILASDGANSNFNPVSRIEIDSEQQKRGAIWVGGWNCGPNASTTTVRAYLVDRRGNHSNALDYTIVCKSAVQLFGGKGPGD